MFAYSRGGAFVSAVSWQNAITCVFAWALATLLLGYHDIRVGLAFSASEMTYIVSGGALNSTHSPGLHVALTSFCSLAWHAGEKL